MFTVNFNPTKPRQLTQAVSDTADKSRATFYQCHELWGRAFRDAAERPKGLDIDQRPSNFVPKHRRASTVIGRHSRTADSERPRSTNTFRITRLSFEVDGHLRSIQEVLQRSEAG